MDQDRTYSLIVADVARHFALSARTVRGHLVTGQLGGVRIGGGWRCSWSDLWAVEQGPLPRGALTGRYQRPLLRKRDLAALWRVSERTVERWIERGLPTRAVLGSVRIAPADAEDWTRRTFGAAAAA